MKNPTTYINWTYLKKYILSVLLLIFKVSIRCLAKISCKYVKYQGLINKTKIMARIQNKGPNLNL